jgi:hypothetical protein
MADNDNEINVYSAEAETRLPYEYTQLGSEEGNARTRPASQHLGGDIAISATDSQDATLANTYGRLTRRNAGVSLRITAPSYQFADYRKNSPSMQDMNGQGLLFRYSPAQIVGLYADPETSDRAIQQAMAVARRHVRETYGEDVTNSESLSPYSLRVVDYAQKRGLVKSPPSHDEPNKRTDWNETKENLESSHADDLNSFAEDYFDSDYRDYAEEMLESSDECHDSDCEECHGEDLNTPGEGCGYCNECEDRRDDIRQNMMTQGEFTEELMDNMDSAQEAAFRREHMADLRSNGTQGGQEAARLETYYNSYRLQGLPVATTSSGVTTTGDPSDLAATNGAEMLAQSGLRAQKVTKYSPEYVKGAVTEALQTGREFRQSAAQLESDQNEAYKEYDALKDRNADDKDLFGQPLDQRGLMTPAEVPETPAPKYKLTARGSFEPTFPRSNWLAARPTSFGPHRTSYRNIAHLDQHDQLVAENDPEFHAAYDDNRYTYDELFGNDSSGASRSTSFSDAVASSSDKPVNRSRFRK